MKALFRSKLVLTIAGIIMIVSAIAIPLSRPQLAFAASFQLSGNIQDSTGNPIAGATVDVFNAGTTTDIASTSSDSSGNYSTTVSGGKYDVKITPPSGSNFSPAIALSQVISANTTLNFILTPIGTVTLNGHVYDPLGNPVPNQNVYLQTSGGAQTTATTDINGSYSLEVSSGIFTLNVSGDNNDFSQSIPQHYELIKNNYSLTQSTALDITVPAKKVSLHVQDGSGNPVSNVAIQAGESNYQFNYINDGGLLVGGNITNASGKSLYGYTAQGPKTDASGNATLWLLPTNGTHTYTFTATPPSGSNFATTKLSNISITDDTQETISMQGSLTLSGHVYDRLGNPLPNQTVYLGSASSTTDSSGSYSLTAASGTYTLEISGNNNDFSLNIPQYYDIMISNYSLAQNTTLDLTIPTQKVNVHVQDASSKPISNAVIQAGETNYQFNNVNDGGLSLGGNIVNATGKSNYGYTASGPKTDASGNVTLWLLPNNLTHTYSFIATPPSGSSYQATTISNVFVTSDTSLTLTMTQPVTLSGHVYDPLGNPLPNQTVYLQTSGGAQTTATTDINGNYSLQISSGTYILDISGDNSDFSHNIPQHYELVENNYLLTQSTALDITVPAKKVSLHVQDGSGNPVSNVAIQAGESNYQFNYINDGGLLVGGNITNASGKSLYGYTAQGPKTDASGNATLWLLPTNGTHTYTFTATPPSGSNYKTFSLSGITVTGDQTELISLQYSHATPTTTATLSPAPDSQGNYPDPTTVTLSATAASGYTIAYTYYTVDGGSQQTYTAPFTVSGSGTHTVTYWSIDNLGVPESPNTKTFTIHTNQPPKVNAIANATINVGDTYSATGSFTDPDSTSWTATVDYGDGSGTKPLTLSGMNFSLSHTYSSVGTITVTVTITDNQGATGTGTATVTVKDSNLGLTNMPANITANATSPQGAVVTYTPPTVVDEDTPLPSVSCTSASGSTFPIGTTTVTCTVSDSDDTNSPVSQSFTVTVKPMLTTSGKSVSATEGSAFSGVVASGTAYGTGALSANIDWGDGTSSTITVTPAADGSYSVSASHTYAEEGKDTIHITVSDGNGFSASTTSPASVSDAALTLTQFAAGPLEHLTAGLAALFTDADPAGQVSDYQATIQWGDGATSTVQVGKNPQGQEFALAGQHSYAKKGSYTVTLTVTDQGGSQFTKTVTVTIK